MTQLQILDKLVSIQKLLDTRAEKSRKTVLENDSVYLKNHYAAKSTAYNQSSELLEELIFRIGYDLELEAKELEDSQNA